MAREPAYSLREFAVKIGVSWNQMRYRWDASKNRPTAEAFPPNPKSIYLAKCKSQTKRFKLSELQKWWDSPNDN